MLLVWLSGPEMGGIIEPGSSARLYSSGEFESFAVHTARAIPTCRPTNTAEE